jgi:hypothetical protein
MREDLARQGIHAPTQIDSASFAQLVVGDKPYSVVNLAALGFPRNKQTNKHTNKVPAVSRLLRCYES